MRFPEYRARRLRKNEVIRGMVRETHLSVKDFIFPLFIIEGKDIKNPIPSMPGHYQLNPDMALKECDEILELGLSAIILFGIPAKKDAVGSEAYNERGVIQNAVREIKKRFGSDIYVITDVCLCEYTDHGHCGIIKERDVDNDSTLEVLARQALSHARAGADMVAPSDMMDGRIGYIRQALDREGFQNVAIMSYAAKFASCFYGPFREAAESAPSFGDRRSYQMDPPNFREALREISLDIEEGADIVMVKPALPYLDIIKTVRERFLHPVAAYQVSGEFAMIMAAAEKGWLDLERAILESTIAIKRAGADLILTYFAKTLAKLIK